MKPLGLERSAIVPVKTNAVRPMDHTDLLVLQRDIRARPEPKFEVGQVVSLLSGETNKVQRRYWDGRDWRYAVELPGQEFVASDGTKLRSFSQVRTVPESRLVAVHQMHVRVAIDLFLPDNLPSPHHPIIW